MSRIEDFKKSLLTMSPEEIREKIRFLRDDRKLSKHTEKAPSAVRKRTGSAVEKMIASLSPEDRKKLLKELQG